MKILSWFWAIIGTVGLLYSVIKVPFVVPMITATIGWSMLLIWLIIATTYRQRLIETSILMEKMKQQNVEFANGFIESLRSQAEEIKRLRREKLFLMTTLENHGKGKSNVKN